MTDLTYIKQRLSQQDCMLASNHLDQAVSALERGESESASAQMRSAVEAMFDHVAVMRLRSGRRGGAARKLLEEKGFLTSKQARCVQAYMDYAGDGGSHAGRSSVDEAQVRYLIGLGVIMLGLCLLPDLVRVEDVLSSMDSCPKDGQFTTSCRTCGTSQKLNECGIHRDGADTVYACRNGCQTLIVVSAPGVSPWPGRGFRFGNYVIRNASDLFLLRPGAAARVVIPASPAALMKTLPGLGPSAQ